MPPRSSRAVASGLSALVAVVLASVAARAVDPYEIQVYDGSANAPAVPGVELHVNTTPSGQKTAPAPELPPHAQTHITLEPSLGILPWWEMGAYLQTTLRGDGVFDYAGVKLRSKFVMPREWHPHWRLGVNFEISRLPEAYDRNRWGTEVRPIVGWDDERWVVVLNPILDTALAGPESDEGPSLEPAFMAKLKIGGIVALGIEYYANFGPVAHFEPWDEQEHYLYEAADLLSVDRVELNAAIGEGLTPSSNALVIKVIVGYAWDQPASPPQTSALLRSR